ncbi:phosphoadenosine phosphosulfate reductase family protein [Brevibacillus halotolerans]|uniref:phosphoadenosine phosphosulfate reductase family protein n=1 Tax=Brevibacillus TaxID=55080 RepID=UPI00215BA7DB|nr:MULTISPECIES: phosphoadenosine phosphosulfate reductase family protein [Brevibacillus]MCR8964155.1 phosphoadenosine phosphosulfate reductase family protein [Brevibacillus laterosporus]MCZ0836310.1 phosphoadenosine phosphosulfate reductase family protein [Brevibacillus halotolerans]
MAKTINILSVSGGKDSTAMWLYAKEQGIEVLPVFADTGHEHEKTYEYLDYLENKLGPIQRVRADFLERIAKKRLYVRDHWPRKLTLDVGGHWYSDKKESGDAPDWEPEDRSAQGLKIGNWKWLPFQKGMSELEAPSVVKRALTILYPTGIPFLDLCLWKGRFPSTKARFCTTYLKVEPIEQQVYLPILSEGNDICSWQGVRAEESPARAKLPVHEYNEGFEVYRPLLYWTVKDVFIMHKKHGIEPNPLYKLGMGRVGCMPCINCKKGELYEIARRFPKEIERVAEWERVVAKASKRGLSTFFPTANGNGNNIDEVVEWSKTAYGGKQYDLIKAIEFDNVPDCSSAYGLCE